MKLLVVEANERVSAALGAALEEQGLQAVCASTGRTALELLDRARPDVVLLDLALPDCDGFGLCGAMRAASTVPILVTTARGDHLSCVRALDLGADDHLVKPYNLAELLARARAVLRRGRLAEPATTGSGTAPAAAVPDEPSEEPPTDLLLAGRVRVDLRERAVLVDGAPTELPDDEFDILAVLARQPGRTLRADQIVEEILHTHRTSLRTALPTRIASLRERLGPSRLVESPEDGYYRLPVPEPYA